MSHTNRIKLGSPFVEPECEVTVDTTLTGKAEAGLFFPPVFSSSQLSKLKSIERGEMWSSQLQGEEKQKKQKSSEFNYAINTF